MSNVLSDEKKQQVLVLGKLGWPLRRIEKATGVRRETAADYLKAAGIVVNGPGRPSSISKPAIRVATDSDAAKPANEEGVTTDFIRCFAEKAPIPLPPSTIPSACEPFREFIEAGINKGRNAVAIWQDLVTPATASPAPTIPSNDSFASDAEDNRRRRRRSSLPHRVKKRRSTMAAARWCATDKPGSIGGLDCLF